MNFSFQHKITYFSEKTIQNIELPQKFTFPFYYSPHPLTELAARDLQHYLENEFDKDHNFGLDSKQKGTAIGKMFGVLVVQDAEGKVGYLSAFSGKLAGTNAHDKFVPPVFDMLQENSFFLQQEELLNAMNREIETLEKDVHYLNAIDEYEQFSKFSAEAISTKKKQLKENKAERKRIRTTQRSVLNAIDYQELVEDLIKQSYRDQHELKVLVQNHQQQLLTLKQKVESFAHPIETLKQSRKEKSAALQNQLFEQYVFFNNKQENKSLGSIFGETVFEKPPAGAGECATPKLLQFAFLHQLKPLAFAEFWWGDSPKSEIRKHKNYYPACSGKCRPILKHMLAEIELEENPLLVNLAADKQIKIVFEDADLVVVNKPHELLSVPGIEIQDSVYSRLQDLLDGVEPLIVHRLDMSTSGLLVVAKNKEAHKILQRQFIKQTVKKRYTALLSNVLKGESGIVDLPMRMDPLDRPRQLVCFENGKKSRTLWQAIERNEQTTKVHFWPITGRTHQLRVHAAHEKGLNAPIVGDDLYGEISERLYLHAGFLEFQHPTSLETLTFEVAADF